MSAWPASTWPVALSGTLDKMCLTVRVYQSENTVVFLADPDIAGHLFGAAGQVQLKDFSRTEHLTLTAEEAQSFGVRCGFGIRITALSMMK